MRAWAGAFCALLFVLETSGAGAENRNLRLADRATQALADVDFSLLPVWHSLYKCGEPITSESCLLQRMTENPTGTARAALVGAALHLAEQIDRGRADSADGLANLRASQAYLVAAAYEAEMFRSDDARAHFRLALERAADVPQKSLKFDPAYTVQSNNGSSVRSPAQAGTSNGLQNVHVAMGVKAKEDADKYYSEAQLVREYATRALAAFDAERNR